MPGRYRGRGLVLCEPAGEAEVFEGAEVVEATKLSDLTVTVELGLSREVTWQLPGENYLHYGREHPFGISLVFVSGTLADDVEELTQMMSDYFAPITDEGLLDRVDRAESVEDHRADLVRAGLGAPRAADERYFRRIAAAMTDGRAPIREGGLWAAMYAYWPELFPLIERMAREDSDQLLREQAIALGKQMKANGITPTAGR